MKNKRLMFRWFAGSVLLLAAGLLGAWVALSFFQEPRCDLSEIHFSYAAYEKDDMPVVKIYFATNREVKSAEQATFEDIPASGLVFGTAEVRIPTGFQIGDMQTPEIPRAVNNPLLATIERVTLLSEADFYADLSERLAQINAKMVNLLVHGMNHTFDSSIRQGGALAFGLNMPNPVVVFAWPTVPGILPEAYARSSGNVDSAAIGLEHFLEGFQKSIHPRKINIVAHSMGAQVVCKTFDALLEEEEWNDAETEIANVVFTAPDVDHGDFYRHFVRQVAVLTRRVTVYVANNDGILALSGFLNGEARAGVRTGRDAPPPGLTTLVAEDAEKLPQIEVIDATFVNNAAYSHGYYSQSRPVFSDLCALLLYDQGAENRRLLRLENAQKANYWIIPP